MSRPLAAGDTLRTLQRRCVDASEVEQLEALPVHGGCAGHVGARGRRSVQAEVVAGPPRWRGEKMLRKIAYPLGALVVLALAVGAGFKP
jgi:hypothetical protein